MFSGTAVTSLAETNMVSIIESYKTPSPFCQTSSRNLDPYTPNHTRYHACTICTLSQMPYRHPQLGLLEHTCDNRTGAIFFLKYSLHVSNHIYKANRYRDIRWLKNQANPQILGFYEKFSACTYDTRLITQRACS